MHQLLDVHLEKDQCRVGNKDDRQCLNMFRKAAINLIKNFKLRNNSKTAISNIMFECLMDPQLIWRVAFENWFPCEIDKLIPTVNSIDELLQALEERGYEIKRVKYISVKALEQHSRMVSLLEQAQEYFALSSKGELTASK